ncbi:hypothetical protein VIGAN_11049600, partial [Vigna angularis var. angularis]
FKRRFQELDKELYQKDCQKFFINTIQLSLLVFFRYFKHRGGVSTRFIGESKPMVSHAIWRVGGSYAHTFR